MVDKSHYKGQVRRQTKMLMQMIRMLLLWLLQIEQPIIIKDTGKEAKGHTKATTRVRIGKQYNKATNIYL